MGQTGDILTSAAGLASYNFARPPDTVNITADLGPKEVELQVMVGSMPLGIEDC